MSRPEHPRVAAVSALLAEVGAAGQVVELPGSARTAAEAAGQLGVPVGAIADSLLFDVDVDVDVDVELARHDRVRAAAEVGDGPAVLPGTVAAR